MCVCVCVCVRAMCDVCVQMHVGGRESAGCEVCTCLCVWYALLIYKPFSVRRCELLDVCVCVCVCVCVL